MALRVRVSRWQRGLVHAGVVTATAGVAAVGVCSCGCGSGSIGASVHARRGVCALPVTVPMRTRAHCCGGMVVADGVAAGVATMLALRMPCRTQATTATSAAAAATAIDTTSAASPAAATQSSPTASAVSDKRFHCSVCKKAFRLELAAKLHVKQAHNDEATVEVGAGPGPASVAPAATAAATSTTDGSNATTATATAANSDGSSSSSSSTTSATATASSERRLPRHLRPAPKPLHSPDRDVAADVMDEMLAMWDKVGVQRLGNTFVHSSMVMKVFAARPGEPVAVPNNNLFSGSTTLSPASAAAMHSRYAAAASLTAAAVASATPQSPYGQLPMFGQQPAAAATAAQQQQRGQAGAAPATAAAAAATVPFASPFANPMLFAATATSPFAQAAAATTATTSDNSTAAVTSPFASASSSTSAAAATANVSGAPSASFPASPFLSETGAPLHPGVVVGGAQDGSADASMSAAAGGMPFASGTADAYGDAAAAAAATAAATRHVCEQCDRSFATYRALRMHSKSKHNTKLPLQLDAAANRHNSNNSTHDALSSLPVYIPSPVDLSMTSPFSTREATVSWTTVDVAPCTHAMSNMTLVGTVLEVDVLYAQADDSGDSGDSEVLLTLFVADTDTNGDDKGSCGGGGGGESAGQTVTLRCVGASATLVQRGVARGDVVFACGTLRLLPVVDAQTRIAHTTPLVVVAPPMGMIAKSVMDVPLVNVAEAVQKICTFLRAPPAAAHGDKEKTAAAAGKKRKRGSGNDDDDDVAQLFAPPPPSLGGEATVDIDVELAFLASPEAHRVPLYVLVPHAVVHGSVCVITPPPQRAFKDKVQALVEAGDAAAARVRRVMDAHKFAAKVREPVAVRAFARSYDDVVVYAVRKYPPQLSGEFLGHHRLPVWVAKRANFAAALHDAMRTVVVSRRGQNAVACRIGHTGLSPVQLEENVRTFVRSFTQHPQGTKLAHVLHIRVAGTNSKGQRAGLPIFAHVFRFPAVKATPTVTAEAEQTGDKDDEEKKVDELTAVVTDTRNNGNDDDSATAAAAATLPAHKARRTRSGGSKKAAAAGSA